MSNRFKSENRIYLKVGSQYVKLVHVQQGYTFLHLLFNGLNTKEPIIKSSWIEKQLSRSEIYAQTYKWKQLTEYPITQLLNYISFHPEGKCFRLKFKNGEENEIKMDTEVGDFIDFIITSDLPDKYKLNTATFKENSHTSTVNKKNAVLRIRGTFCTREGNILNHPFFGLDFKEQGVQNNVLMAVYDEHEIELSDEAIHSKPDGTTINFLFHQKNNLFTSSGLIIK